MRIHQSGNVTKVYFDDTFSGWEQWLWLRSDAHHDSAHCRRDLEIKHLDAAKARNALILDGGDMLDAMQGKYDPRRNYDDLRNEYKVANYYDAIEDDAISHYAPYASSWLLMARGNHETGVLKHANIDLTSRITGRLNRETGSGIIAGGYGGWVIFYFSEDGGKGNRSSIRLKYFHGAGGDAPVTRGVIQTARQAVYIPDADIIWNGHNHNGYVMPIKRERITAQGRLYFDTCWHVRTPGYKDDYADGSGGWEVERGSVPKPQGGCWIRLYSEDHRVRAQAIPEME